jgi:hypothetical protein
MAEAVAEGRSRAITLVGEAGRGKSRLLAEAITGISLPSLVLRGYQMEEAVPFSAARSVLRHLGGMPEGSMLERLLMGDSPSPADPIRIFEAAHKCLTPLLPVLLVLDDLQWADRQSVALVHFLVRAAIAEEASLGLLVAARPGPAVTRLEESLRLLLGPDLQRVALDPLGREEGIKLARSLDSGLTEEQAEHLWERGGGSPFWLEVLATGGDDEVERLLEARLERSGADGAEIAALLTVASRPLPADALGELLGWPAERVDEAVARLAGAGVTIGGAGVTTAHDLIREVLSAGIPPDRVRGLHRKLADWLEGDSSDDLFTAAEGLAHRRATGDLPIASAGRLLAHPQRRLLGDEVFGQLVEIVDEAGDEARDLRWRIAELAEERGDLSLALLEWQVLADQTAGSRDRATAALRGAEAAFGLDRHQQCRALLSRARDEGGDEPALRVQVDALEARLLRWVDNRHQEAAELTERSLRGLQAIDVEDDGASRARFVAYGSAYERALVAGDPSGMLAAAEEASAVAISEEASLKAGLDAALCLPPLGRWEEGETRLADIWGQARRKVLPRLAAITGPELAQTLLVVGRLEEAASVAREAVARADRLSGVESAAVARRVLHLVELMKGGGVAALRGLQADVDTTSPHYRIGDHQTLAWWWARLQGSGAADRVSSHLAAASALVEEMGCHRCRIELLLRGAEALARAGRRQEAEDYLAEARRTGGWSGAIFEYWWRRSEAALATKTPGGEVAWREVVAEATKMGMRLDALWARLDLTTELEGVDGEAAVDELVAIRLEAAEMGVVAAGREADQRLRDRGFRTWRR